MGFRTSGESGAMTNAQWKCAGIRSLLPDCHRPHHPMVGDGRSEMAHHLGAPSGDGCGAHYRLVQLRRRRRSRATLGGVRGLVKVRGRPPTMEPRSSAVRVDRRRTRRECYSADEPIHGRPERHVAVRLPGRRGGHPPQRYRRGRRAPETPHAGLQTGQPHPAHQTIPRPRTT
jgi:hypothetical protein